MPIYEYRCKACGSTSEYITGIGKDEDICCKKCGSSEMERILSAASFTSGISERTPGRTCCGREERCEAPPCSTGGTCRREQ